MPNLTPIARDQGGVSPHMEEQRQVVQVVIRLEDKDLSSLQTAPHLCQCAAHARPCLRCTDRITWITDIYSPVAIAPASVPIRMKEAQVTTQPLHSDDTSKLCPRCTQPLCQLWPDTERICLMCGYADYVDVENCDPNLAKRWWYRYKEGSGAP